jgi:hypothetical protein
MTATISAPLVSSAPAGTFAQDHFGAAPLGHKARNACLVRVAEQICRHPGGTLPTTLANPAAYKAMDRLMNEATVTHASVLQPHLERTRARAAQHTDVLLFLHDLTVLDYSGRNIPALGPVGNGNGRGYLCYNTLVIDPNVERTVWGLAYQKLHVPARAPKHESVKEKRARANRESRLWSEAVESLGPPTPGACPVDVADRGADIFEFLATETRLGRAFLVRASYHRVILTTAETGGERHYLFT